MDKKYYIGRFLFRYRWFFYLVIFLPMAVLRDHITADWLAWMEQYYLTWIIGGILLAKGCGIRIYAARYIGWKGQPGDPLKRQLATEGPYRFTRNPLYWGNIIGFGGAAFLLKLLWYVPVAIFAIFILHHLLITWYEEKRMNEKSGADYQAYYQRTPRWGPKLSALFTRSDAKDITRFPWGRVLMAELGTIGGFAGALAVALIKEFIVKL